MSDDHVTVVPTDFFDAVLDSPPARNEALTEAAQQNRDVVFWDRLTPAEWVQRWDNLTPEQRLKCAEHIMNGAEQAYRCSVVDHEGRIKELQECLEAALRRLEDPPPERRPKRAAAAVAGEPRMFANEIQSILRDLGLTRTVGKINATANPEPSSHNAMIFLTDQATEDTTKQLMDAFTARGWVPTDHPNNIKIHVWIPAPDKRSAPSGETP